MTTRRISRGRQLVLWPGGTRIYRGRQRKPRYFMSRGGGKLVLSPQPQPQEPTQGNGSTEQLSLNLYPRPRIQQPDSQSDTYYFSQSTGKFHRRAKNPGKRITTYFNPSYLKLQESYNFLMAYYKSLDN